MIKPTTEPGQKLLESWKVNPKELWFVDDVAAAISAIEKRAAKDALALLVQTSSVVLMDGREVVLADDIRDVIARLA